MGLRKYRGYLASIFFILLALLVYDYLKVKIRRGHENTILSSEIKRIEKQFYLSVLRDRGMENGHVYTPTREFIHQERIGRTGIEYSLYIDPEQSPVSGSIKIINSGKTVMGNIRLFINNRTFYQTTGEMVDSILREGMTGKEKVFAIWNFIRERRYHWGQSEMLGPELNNPVRFVNVYGYGFCGDVARNFAILCEAAGLSSRICTLEGHAVAEVFYNDSWHLFDPDSEAFYLNDSQTIASLSEIEDEPYLVLRTHHPNRLYEEIKPHIASLYSSSQDNFYSRLSKDDGHDMRINLRPGESFTHPWKVFDSMRQRQRPPYPQVQTNTEWWQKGETPSFHTTYYTDKPPFSGKAVFDFKPKIEKDILGSIFDECENLSLEEASSKEVFVSNKERKRPASALIENRYPFVIVGGEIRGEFWPSSEEDYLEIGIIKFGDEVKRLRIDNLKKKRTFSINLNDVFNRRIPRPTSYQTYEDACYQYSVRLSIFCKEKGGYGLRNLEIETCCQATPFSPWVLRPGANRIRFTATAEEDVDGQIIQTYKTNRHIQAFKGPPLPIFPKDVVDKDDLCLRFRPVRGARGEPPHSYYLIVSPRKDFLWPVSPGCEVDLKGDVTEWVPPETFFLKGRTYYWRLAAKDIFGHKSEYSRTEKFVIQ
ncbi:transglutaminase-like domain-containing protein [bacterium]|nr:transglutaminase-like domain-containing protein [bacterium]